MPLYKYCESLKIKSTVSLKIKSTVFFKKNLTVDGSVILPEVECVDRIARVSTKLVHSAKTTSAGGGSCLEAANHGG